MEIKNVSIKNFRNFEAVEFDTTRKNIIIGINDVGKTNLLYALRIIFDYQLRNKELIETDFFKSDTSKEIEITIALDFNDEDDENEKILAGIGALNQVDKTSGRLKIRYKCCFEEEPIFEWCVVDNDGTALFTKIPNSGLNRTKLDNIFKPAYIDSQMKFDSTLKEFKRKKLKDFGEENFSNRENIDLKIEQINKEVAMLKEVESLQNNIETELSNLKTDFEPIVRSNIAIEGLHNSLDVYTRYNEDGEEAIYPTAGDGKKKLVEYAMRNSIINSKEYFRFIPIIFIEEPENHLHYSMQMQLLNLLSSFKHSFIATHSADILYNIPDEMNIIRLAREKTCITAKSSIFNVPEEYKIIRHKYQKNLITAMFYENVFLVEGYSEKLIWDRALNLYGVNRHNKYVLNIVGTDFEPYYSFLNKLGINTYVRTDNDIKYANKNKIELSGFNRIQNLIECDKRLENINGVINTKEKSNKEDIIKRWSISKKEYNKNKEYINKYKEKNIYLSEIDLENDIISVLRESNNIRINYDEVTDLQKSKWHNLLEKELGKEILSEDGIDKLLKDPKFVGLREFIYE